MGRSVETKVKIKGGNVMGSMSWGGARELGSKVRDD